MARHGLCPAALVICLPWLFIFSANEAFGTEPHVPEEYRATFQYSEAMPGEEAPELIAAELAESPLLAGKGCAVPPEPLNPAAPTVVILPPRLSSHADMSVRVAAELACDRLAQEIVAAGLARVVDRQQLDRLLRERGLAAEPPRPMVSFDAMLRLDVDAPALVPTARLSVIDLAHGNPLGEAEYGWPLREKDVPALVSQCREALGQMGKPKDGRLRVRFLGVENPERNPRLAPLAARLGQVFEQALARSPALVHVRHLDAGSAMEESLLLLMGLSQLPGGRRFVPQADAAIELSVRERNGRGKTFEETPIEIVVAIDRAGKADAQSLLIHGTVATFDGAIARAWQKLSEVLREAQPAAADEWFGDMAVRHRQAEAELRAASAILHEEPRTRDVQKLLARVAHAEAALKLDPAFEDAAYEHLAALCNLCFRTFTRSPPDQVDELAERILRHAVRYFEQFGSEAEHHSEVYNACRIAVRTSFGTFGSSSNLPSTPRILQTIRHAKWILEHSLKHHGRASADGDHARVLLIVGRAMRQAGIAQDECEAWVDSILRQCRLNEAGWTDAGDVSHKHVLRNSRIWFRAAELAVEDGNMDRAQRLITELQGRLASSPKTPAEIELRRLRGLILMMDDAAALAEFQRWAAAHDKRVVQLVELRWPAIDVFPREEPLDHRSEHTGVELGGISVRAPSQTHPNEFRPISPLAEGEGCLYVVGGDEPIGWQQFRGMSSVSRSQAIGYIRLDDAGGTAGERRHASGAGGSASWHAPTWLRPPDVTAPLHVLDARCFAGRLYLGTLQTGLLVFDPKAETWSSFTVEEGLPEKAVTVIHPLDERTLFCVGQSDLGQPVCYTLTLPEGKVTLRHRADPANFKSMPTLLWQDGEALRAWAGSGLYVNLLAEHAEFVRPDYEVPYGWGAVGGTLHDRHRGGFISFAEVNGRRFVTHAGLHEVDPHGMILHTWRGQCDYEGDFGRAFSVPLPPGCPIQAMDMVTAGGLLVFVDRESVLAWDPKTDTWYGPLDTATTYYALGTDAGIWLAARDRVTLLSTGNMLVTAERTGRVMTTDQYRQRQQEVIAAMSPLDRAKVAYSMRQLDQAKELAQTVLEDDPECAEALLLMGYLHDLWCMNRPETALEYYHRLAKLESDRNASFTGMYRRFVLLRTLKRWSETLATIDEITGQFPRLHERQQGSIDWWRNHIQKKLGETDAKPAAKETSNMAEGPGN